MTDSEQVGCGIVAIFFVLFTIFLPLLALKLSFDKTHEAIAQLERRIYLQPWHETLEREYRRSMR